MSNPTLDELLSQQQTLQQQIDEARLRESGEALQQIKALIKKFDFTPEQVFAAGKSNTEVKKVQPKYRNPATGETWTGRGKPPLWIQNQDREPFLIA